MIRISIFCADSEGHVAPIELYHSSLSVAEVAAWFAPNLGIIASLTDARIQQVEYTLLDPNPNFEPLFTNVDNELAAKFNFWNGLGLVYSLVVPAFRRDLLVVDKSLVDTSKSENQAFIELLKGFFTDEWGNDLVSVKSAMEVWGG